MSLRCSESILTVDQAMESSDLITQIVIHRSNQNLSYRLQRPGALLLRPDYALGKQSRQLPWPILEGAQTRAIGHQKRYGFFLRALEDVRNSFCTLTVKETDDGRPATGKRLSCSATVARAGSSGALAWETTLMAAVQVGDPPPSVELV
jgi:hypothetical protein